MEDAEYKMSFLPIVVEKKDKEYNEKLEQYVKKSCKNSRALKLNNFSRRYKDYTSILKSNIAENKDSIEYETN